MAASTAAARSHGHRTVRTYTVGGFAACVAVLAVLIAVASSAIATRERDRAFTTLAAAAEGGAAWLDPTTGSLDQLLTSLAEDPGIASGDGARCQPVFDALATGVAGAHLHLLGPDGTERCSLRVAAEEIADRPLPRGEWAERAIAEGGLVVSTPLTDPLSDRMAVIYATPVGGDGSVLAAVLYTNEPAIDVPGLTDDVRLVVLGPDRRQVIAASSGTDVRIGTRTTGTALARPVRRGHAVTDLDGVRRYYQEATVPMVGWHVLAGYDVDVALAGAHSQRRWLLGIGGVAMTVVLLLGLLFARRLARPLRQFADALERSGAGDDAARAPLDGPAELVVAAGRFNDLIEDRIAREEQLARRARHDGLTGLLNRSALLELLEARIAAGQPAAVVFIDLDRFKLLNDVHGHAAGDELLVALGPRLVAAASDGVVVGRVGGDEFLAICPTDDPGVATTEARSLLAAVAEPLVLGDGLEVLIGGSAGIACLRDGERAADLVRDADTAMYRAKASGTGNACTFDAAMREWSARQLNVEHDLHGALERDELVVHYQTIRDLDDPSRRRAEALVRWRHPTDGLLSPAGFIDVAEASGLITRIGDVVLRKATAMAAAVPDLTISVNVSPAQLAGGVLVEQVRGALAASGLPPERLCVEVTETGLLDDLDAAAEVLARIRALGVEVAIDDFGTGWSSLSWLQTLPVDEVKVDRSFVQRLTNDPASVAIVRALADLSRALDVRVVAEGVETAEQLDAVRSLGLHVVQGFLFARPVPEQKLRGAWAATPVPSAP